jgi:hypothetical protein
MLFNKTREETLYVLSQEDAYRIDGLISTLAMAVSEILEMGKVIVPAYTGEDANPELACEMLAEAAGRIHQEKMDKLDSAEATDANRLMPFEF